MKQGRLVALSPPKLSVGSGAPTEKSSRPTQLNKADYYAIRFRASDVIFRSEKMMGLLMQSDLQNPTLSLCDPIPSSWF